MLMLLQPISNQVDIDSPISFFSEMLFMIFCVSLEMSVPLMKFCNTDIYLLYQVIIMARKN